MDAPDDNGWTPLVTAAATGSEACVTLLLRAGAKVNAADHYGVTALHMAPLMDNEACVSMLLQAGANVNITDSYGDTPLHQAAGKGSARCVALLVKAGADVNVANQSAWTPLLRAVEQRKSSCVSQLLKAGAKPNAPTKRGYAPLHAAVMQTARRVYHCWWGLALMWMRHTSLARHHYALLSGSHSLSPPLWRFLPPLCPRPTCTCRLRCCECVKMTKTCWQTRHTGTTRPPCVVRPVEVLSWLCCRTSLGGGVGGLWH